MPGLVAGQYFCSSFRPKLVHQLGAPQFALKHTHENVPNLENRQAVLDRPRFGSRACHLVLDGQDDDRVDVRVHAIGVSFEHHFGVSVQRLPIALGRRLDLKTAHLLVVFDARLAYKLRPATVGFVTIVVHVPQPVLSSCESLSIEGVVGRRGPNVGNAVLIANYLNVAIQALHRSGPTGGRYRRSEVLDRKRVRCHLRCAPSVQHSHCQIVPNHTARSKIVKAIRSGCRIRYSDT